MSDGVRFIQRPCSGITPEQARDTRSRAWAYILECWRAKKGEQHVVTTNEPIDIGNGPRKTEQEKT